MRYPGSIQEQVSRFLADHDVRREGEFWVQHYPSSSYKYTNLCRLIIGEGLMHFLPIYSLSIGDVVLFSLLMGCEDKRASE